MRALALLFFLMFAALVMSGCSGDAGPTAPEPTRSVAPPAPLDTAAWIPPAEVAP